MCRCVDVFVLRKLAKFKVDSNVLFASFLSGLGEGRVDPPTTKRPSFLASVAMRDDEDAEAILTSRSFTGSCHLHGHLISATDSTERRNISYRETYRVSISLGKWQAPWFLSLSCFESLPCFVFHFLQVFVQRWFFTGPFSSISQILWFA